VARPGGRGHGRRRLRARAQRRGARAPAERADRGHQGLRRGDHDGARARDARPRSSSRPRRCRG
jgi:hypothetical protein